MITPLFGVTIAALYMQIMGWLKVAINLTTMLFLTVCTIPGVLSPRLVPALSAILLSAAFFGSFTVAARYRHLLRLPAAPAKGE